MKDDAMTAAMRDAGFESVGELLAAYKLAIHNEVCLRAHISELLESAKPPQPLTAPQTNRLWHNSPTIHKDVVSYAGFVRIVVLLEQVHRIRED